MIRLEKSVPNVYYNQSRDFQFIGRLYDMVLNSVKTNVDLMKALPLSDNLDKAFVDLAALTLGLELKGAYSSKQLLSICKVFPEILKTKGTLTSIKIMCNAILSAEGIVNTFRCKVIDNEVLLYIPRELKDIALLRELLNYILPAGMTCTIVRAVSLGIGINTKFGTNDTIIANINNENIDSKTKKGIIVRPDDIKPYDVSNKGLFINTGVNGSKE